MNKIRVLVLVAPDDAVPFLGKATLFQEAIDTNPQLRDRVELRFAGPAARIDAISDAEVVVCGAFPPELLAAAPRLRWVSFWIAGLDGRVSPEMEARNLLVTNASGVHAPNIAEHVLACMLMFTRRLPYYVRAQIAREWTHDHTRSFDELTGQTLGIAGFGRVGEAVAARALSFGMRVIATKRDVTGRDRQSVMPDVLYSPEELPHMLAQSDHVCIAMPYTRETHRLFDTVVLALMKPTAYLYNISRGKIVDEQALIAALQGGALRGAALDVFESEPLAPDSPLWGMENVIITPHVAGFTPYYFARAARLLAENLVRYLAGRPLENLYDPRWGY